MSWLISSHELAHLIARAGSRTSYFVILSQQLACLPVSLFHELPCFPVSLTHELPCFPSSVTLAQISSALADLATSVAHYR
jgi:hypothetical protein